VLVNDYSKDESLITAMENTYDRTLDRTR